jgi:DnaJ-class molecular chaperone
MGANEKAAAAYHPMRRETCTYCQGMGSIETSQRVGSGDWMRWVPIRQTCGICGGSGYTITREPCVEPKPPKIGVVRDYENPPRESI